MTPEYPGDSLIIVREVEPESIQPGDVITFVANADGMVVTHRVVSADPVQQTFTTKGDANDVNDAVPVLWKNTVGKVVFGIPLLGGPFSVVSAKGCRWLMTGIAAAFLLLSLGRSFYRDRKAIHELSDRLSRRPVAMCCVLSPCGHAYCENRRFMVYF